MKERGTFEQVLTDCMTNVLKGVFYAVTLGVLGLAMSWVMKWPPLKGSYVLILLAGVLALCMAVIGLIGTPRMRFEFFTGTKKRGNTVESIKRTERKALGTAGVSPAIIGVVMIAIGLFLEALTHL